MKDTYHASLLKRSLKIFSKSMKTVSNKLSQLKGKNNFSCDDDTVLTRPSYVPKVS